MIRMLKEYVYRGSTWQFDPERAPVGATPVEGKAETPVEGKAPNLAELQDAAKAAKTRTSRKKA